MSGGPRRCSSKAVVAAGCTWLLGCLGDASLGLDQRSSLRADAAVGGSGDAAIEAAMPAGPDPLTVEIKVAGAPTRQTALLCPATCAAVEVSVTGGTPPYRVTWNDGADALQRSLCPPHSTTYQVTITDALGANVSGHSAEASLDVSVTPCPVSGSLCLQNASLEGTPVAGSIWFSGSPWDAVPWDDCEAVNRDRLVGGPHVVGPGSTLAETSPLPAASAGNTYAYLESVDMRATYLGQTLCAPLQAGTEYHLQLDLASLAASAEEDKHGSVQLQIYASTDPCRADELVWTSAQLEPRWTHYCVTLRSATDATALVLTPVGTDGNAAVLIDNLVPVDRCP